MSYLVIQDGVVVNRILVGDDFTAPAGWTLIEDTGQADIGWTVSGEDFTLPAPEVEPVPQSVEMFKARSALRQFGLFEAVDAHCHAAGGLTLDAWEYAAYASRQGMLVTSLAPAFGLSEQQLDDLFRLANSIEA